ncbi:MAG TPA: DUF6600 domain-containing protein [Hyphomicrobiaceae bacterium]|nr:DUF6600 domain-containing protein [Hyphomicrobiaceae bacterium]
MPRFMRGALTLAMAVGLAIAATAWTVPASAQGRHVDYSEFYEALEPFGRWFEHPRWGLVWWPYAQQEEDWRPYSRGQWVYTEDHGWYWDADEEWGWATYHYGRWVLDERYGWLWVPGNEWGPAWVAWRESEDYIGWAPLPPDAVWEPGYGVRYHYAEYERSYWAPIWCFVHPSHLLAPRVWVHFAPRSRHVYILGRTRYATKYALIRSRIYNHGVDVRHIARLTRKPVPTLHVRDLSSPRELIRRRGERDFVGVYRPRLAAASERPRFSPRLTAPDAIEDVRRRRISLRELDRYDRYNGERSGRPDGFLKREEPGTFERRTGPEPFIGNSRRAPSPAEDDPRLRSRLAAPPPFAAIAPPQSERERGGQADRFLKRDGPSASHNLAPPGDDPRLRRRPAAPPPFAAIPSPQSPRDDGTRAFRGRSLDRPPSDLIAPPGLNEPRPRTLRVPDNDRPGSADLRSRQEFQLRHRPLERDRSSGPTLSGNASPRAFQPRAEASPRAFQAPPQNAARSLTNRDRDGGGRGRNDRREREPSG